MKKPAAADLSDQDKQDEINELIEKGGQPQTLDAPNFYITTVRAMSESNNVNLVFSRWLPVNIPGGNRIHQGAVQTPIVALDMSPQTAKDLFLILQAQLDRFEKEWGAIETEYTRRRATKK